MSDALLPIDYTDRDYASLRQAMIDGIAVRVPQWTSRSPQDFGIVLIELFATMGDVLSYYIDRVANEAFLLTATQRDSVLKIAQGLNYRPSGSAASTSDVTFTTNPAVLVTIPAYTLVRSYTADGSAPIVFSTDAVLSVPPGVTTGTISVTQGTPVFQEQIGTANGMVDQSFALLQLPVVESSVLIQVQESTLVPPNVWSFVTNLVDARPNDNVYTSTIDANGVVTVTFGDGVNGKIPPASAVVRASYRVGGGEGGNVPAGSIVEMVNPITNVTSLTNLVAATGGASTESTDSVRFNAPRSLTALNRVVTLADYGALALQVPSVGKANAEALVYSNVTVYIAPIGGGAPTQSLLNDVVNYLNPLIFAGVTLTAGSPSYAGIDVSVTITVDPAFPQAQVQTAVTTAIQNFFSFDAQDFGASVTVGDVYTMIADVPGVLETLITQLSRRGQGGVSDIFINANEIPISGTLLTVNAVGGIVAGNPVGPPASATPVPPTVPGPPVVDLLRCDPLTMHLALHWAPSTYATQYFVELQYLDATGTSIGSTVIGPTTNFTSFTADVPNNNLAITLNIRVQAFNANIGPVLSPYTPLVNSCIV